MTNIRNILFFLLLFVVHPSIASEYLIEAESFSEKGGWKVDQQFMDQMGSPYLLAHGMGTPVADAKTKVNFEEKGTYYVYVRTYNWTSPWYKGKGPGCFKIQVAGKTLPTVLGCEGEKWTWQYAGKVNVKSSEATVVLKDMTGFDGRIDAVFFTTQKDLVPPMEGNELADFRKKMLGLPAFPKETSSYDLVVVGGGIAGMCAAVTAARMGCKVALVNDRPVLGGNNSAEVRVHLGGYAEIGPNEGLGRMLREFGHSKRGNAQPAEYYEDDKKQNFIEAEKNVTLYANYRAVSVQMNGTEISSVVIKHIETGEEICLKAALFSDCTGDGTIGYLAGADFRMGRESRSEFGESLAPEKADSLTMGASIQWYSKDNGKKTFFPKFNYGLEFNENNCEKVKMGEWTWETGMNKNQIDEAELIRDYGLLVVYSNWSFLKNEWKEKEKYSNWSLEWVAYIAGKRESRRLMGDYILKQDDIDKGVFHEDASFTTTWSIDLHFPDPKNSELFPGQEFKAATKHLFIHPYAVPYRCLYSRNVNNLFMAGRNISTTHVGLGTVRVMRTTGMMGEVVGMAAALCRQYGVLPREIYQHHLPELKKMMKEGAGVKSELPDNQKFNLPNRLLEKPRAFGQGK